MRDVAIAWVATHQTLAAVAVLLALLVVSALLMRHRSNTAQVTADDAQQPDEPAPRALQLASVPPTEPRRCAVKTCSLLATQAQPLVRGRRVTEHGTQELLSLLGGGVPMPTLCAHHARLFAIELRRELARHDAARAELAAKHQRELAELDDVQARDIQQREAKLILESLRGAAKDGGAV